MKKGNKKGLIQDILYILDIRDLFKSKSMLLVAVMILLTIFLKAI